MLSTLGTIQQWSIPTVHSYLRFFSFCEQRREIFEGKKLSEMAQYSY
jgi:hypothetical protein